MPRKVFISYARDNRSEINQLVSHLDTLGDEAWVDSALRGGQAWWDEILRRIKDCDVFIAVVSHASLRSTACNRELDWAEGLGKAVLPISLEPPGMALPRRIQIRQIVDYSDPRTRDQAALRLAGALASVGPPRPLPRPLPEPPAVPLSYLADLIDQAAQTEPLSHDQQHQILTRLDQAVHAADAEERRGGLETLERFSARPDLYVDVYRRIEQLRGLDNSGPAGHPGTNQGGWQQDSPGGPGYRFFDQNATGDSGNSTRRPPPPPPGEQATRRTERPPTPPGQPSGRPQPPGRRMFGSYNSLAVWALISAILCPGVSVVLGFVAIKQIDRTGENGRGLAIGGIVIGGLFLVLAVISVLTQSGQH
jgi:hypothetical protein